MKTRYCDVMPRCYAYLNTKHCKKHTFSSANGTYRSSTLTN